MFSFKAAAFNKLANSAAYWLFSQTIILDVYKLSYKALPSLKNSGENIMLSIPYFSFIFLVNPTGIVDLITIVVSMLRLFTF